MSEDSAFSSAGGQEDLMAKVDTSVPVSARIWNYWMGGEDWFPIDKQAGAITAVVLIATVKGEIHVPPYRRPRTRLRG